MTEINIEKNIPMPPKRAHQKKGDYKFILDNMKIGDSILLEDKATAHRFRCNLAHHGFYMTSRLIENGKYRLWRTG